MKSHKRQPLLRNQTINSQKPSSLTSIPCQCPFLPYPLASIFTLSFLTFSAHPFITNTKKNPSSIKKNSSISKSFQLFFSSSSLLIFIFVIMIFLYILFLPFFLPSPFFLWSPTAPRQSFKDAAIASAKQRKSYPNPPPTNSTRPDEPGTPPPSHQSGEDHPSPHKKTATKRKAPPVKE